MNNTLQIKRVLPRIDFSQPRFSCDWEAKYIPLIVTVKGW